MKYTLYLSLILFILAACADNNNTGKINDPLTLISSTDASLPILSNEDIQYTFNKRMNINTLQLGGAVNDDSHQTTWSLNNTRLSISPTVAWTEGSNRSLQISVADENGSQLAFIMSFHIVDGLIYVSSTGVNGNDGSRAQPLPSIAAAVTQALGSNNSSTAIYIAAGTYNVNSDAAGTSLTLAEGISLYGGFSSNNWANRNPSAYETIIQDNAVTAGNHQAILADVGITTDTVLDGLKIIGASAGNAYGIRNTGGSPVIKNCNIVGGATAVSAGIINTNNASPVILSNTIVGGGVSDGTSAAIQTGGSPLIANNYLYGGVGYTATGLEIIGGSATVSKNRIEGGNASGSLINDSSYGITIGGNSTSVISNNMISGGESSITYGISSIQGSTPIIRNNTIDGGVASQSSVGISVTAGNPVIDNNIIFTSTGTPRVCLSNQADEAFAASLKNNNLFGCVDALYRDFVISAGNCPNNAGFDCYSNITDVNNAAITNTGTAANRNIAATLVSLAGGDGNVASLNDNNWQLTASTSCQISEGGLNGAALSWTFSDDFNSNNRSAPWSIGAYEYNGSCL